MSGSPEYVSPEQASGENRIDGRSDLYSLGCVMYEMLAGSALFQGVNTHAVVVQRFKYPAPRLETLPDTIPAEVVAVLGRALKVDPDRRHASAAEFARELVAAAYELNGTTSKRPARQKRQWRQSRGIDRS